MLRLRLQIQRNELPTVNTLWPVGDTQLRNTIVQLLEQVNGVFPLESETWGLEHYTVSIGNYECLHYHEIGSVCKDEDEVVIRPLQYAEVRARTLLGRDQIAPDGRHLHDGVPWGRPLLRKPVRPLVRIPPRKRQRVEEVLDASEMEDDAGIKAIMGGIEETAEIPEDDRPRFEEDLELEDEDEEEEEDFMPGDEDDEIESDDASSEDASSDNDDTGGSSQSESASDSNSDSDADSGSSSDGSSDDSSESSDGSDDGSEASFEGFATEKSEISRAQAASQILDEANEPPAETSIGVPFQGTNTTRQRNARRRDQRTLKHLVGKGVLPKDSGLKELHELKATGYEIRVTKGPKQSASADTERATAGSENDGAPYASTVCGGSAGVVGAQHGPSEIELEGKRRELLDAIASGGIDVTESSGGKVHKRKAAQALDDDDDPPDELSTKQIPRLATDHEGAAPDGLVVGQQPPRTGNDRQARMIFGALGVRAPKTENDKDVLQKKLAVRAGRNLSGVEHTLGMKRDTSAVNDLPERTGEEDEDAELWRENIELSAVECVGEPLTYPEPPFPFRKHWHNKKKRNGSVYMAPNKRRKKGSRDAGAMQHDFTESYDKYNTDGTGDALNYDDVEDDDEDYGDWDDSAFLEDTWVDEADDPASQQLLKETVTAKSEPSDEFPSLPPDLNMLPSLSEESAKVGDYIIFDELACSAATNWQPKTLTLTAHLLSKNDEDGSWEVLLAQRDVAPRVYDDTGKRIYAKFEMEDLSEGEDGEDGEERLRNVQWIQLGVPKLLLRSGATASLVQEE